MLGLKEKLSDSFNTFSIPVYKSLLKQMSGIKKWKLSEILPYICSIQYYLEKKKMETICCPTIRN